MTSFLKHRSPKTNKTGDITQLNKIISDLEDFIDNTDLQYNGVFIQNINRLFTELRLSYGSCFYKKCVKRLNLIHKIIKNPSISTANKSKRIIDTIDYLNVLRTVYILEFKKI